MEGKARDDLRIAAIEEHVRQENRHDLDGLLSTFGGLATYDDGPWGGRYEGLPPVREYYAGLFRAAPAPPTEGKNRPMGKNRGRLTALKSRNPERRVVDLPPS